MTMRDYRDRLRGLPTMGLIAELDLVRKDLERRGFPSGPFTNDWQARELLAELGARQLRIDGLLEPALREA